MGANQGSVSAGRAVQVTCTGMSSSVVLYQHSDMLMCRPHKPHHLSMPLKKQDYMPCRVEPVH